MRYAVGNKAMMIPEPREARKGEASILETEFELVEKGGLRQPGSPLYPWEKAALVFIIFLTGLLGFGLGRMDGGPKEPVVITPPPAIERPAARPETSAQGSPAVAGAGAETVVGSRTGSKYHYPWCSGAQRISPANLVTFASIEEARAAGYTPASNCKGLR